MESKGKTNISVGDKCPPLRMGKNAKSGRHAGLASFYSFHDYYLIYKITFSIIIPKHTSDLCMSQRTAKSLPLLVCGVTGFIKFAKLTVDLLNWLTNILL